MSDLPMVSVIIPCRNERKYIAVCLDSILANGYPKDRLEVLVADGLSEDGTRDILQDYMKRYPFIKMLDNPKKRTSNALNIAIARAKGEVIVRLDAHARYEDNYVRKCVEYLEKYSADNVGGIRRTEPQENTFIGKALAFSVSSRFTAGTAHYRVGVSAPKWVDTVFCGCYRKDVFKRVGLFNENLIRTEDREFNQRLRDLGGKILLAPDIQCTYYSRSKLLDFIRWTISGPEWIFYGSKVAGRRIFAFRNVVPLAFLGSLIVSFAAAWFVPVLWWVFGGIVSIYSVASIASAVPLATKERDLRYLLVGPMIFAMIHVLYGVASIYGILKAVANVPPRLE